MIRLTAVFDLVPYSQGHTAVIGVNLTLIGRLKPQLYKHAPACGGFKTLEFPLVRAGGLGFYRRDFQSPGLKLTPMHSRAPLQVIRTSLTRKTR
jgi:hypothetical protein